MSRLSSEKLLSSLSDECGLSAEDMQLAVMQGLIAAQISMKRQELKMNQSEFAAFMNVSQALVSRWETGECNFTLTTLVTLASKLGLDMQCPFVTSGAPVYSLPGADNIYPINGGWQSECSDIPNYSESAEWTPEEM